MKYQAKYIDQLDNQITDGELINEYQIFGLKPVRDKNWMFVRWTLGLNIGNGRHIKHWSLTVFEVEELNLNYLKPTDKERIDAFATMAQIGLINANAMFIETNKSITEKTAEVFTKEQLIDSVIEQINKMSN